MGAPRKHPPTGATAEIERLASQGYALRGIGKFFRVNVLTLKRWMDEDESMLEAYEQGKEAERQALHALITRDAVAGKPANANAMFLLKCRHGYRETDSPANKIDVNVAVAQPVMIVKDHGTDEEWAAKALEQQRRLVANAAK